MAMGIRQTMQKIISLFARNYDGDRKVRNEVVPGAEWVLAGEGVATRKFDGTCCRVKDGVLWKRFDAKKGRPLPIDFEPAQDPDPISGHWPGWTKVGDGPEDRWFREAFVGTSARAIGGMLPNGTYELCGPKINGNPEGLNVHVLIQHGCQVLDDVPRDFEGLREWTRVRCYEGIVWHHPDGRMVKIKRKDFAR